MELKFDEQSEYNQFLDYLDEQLLDKNSNLCNIIKNDLKNIRGNYSNENKRKIFNMIITLRELESIQLPIFSEWYKYFKK